MKREEFDKKLIKLQKKYTKFIQKENKQKKKFNGIYTKYKNPVITAEHLPLNWRFDFNYDTNPFLQERLGINSTCNAGAMLFNGKIVLSIRVEGYDRKSFFAIAESENGIDNFKFWDKPILMPENDNPDTNVYDMRFVEHEDGWIYGLFCAERHDDSKPDDTSAAVASCGIARTKNLKNWERLPDLVTYSGQQRNVVLHPEFINGKYGFYTRPQDGFIDTGSGGGIGWGLSESMENPEVKEEKIMDPKIYHTIYELKNGLGPAPIKTEEGWLNLAHGVRNTAAGFRYVLYLFLSDLEDPSKIIAKPGGFFIAPEGEERVGDVSNVVFSNGWVAKDNGEVFIYYASCDTRMHVATSTIDQLLDYVKNTPPDRFRSYTSVEDRLKLIEKNEPFIK